ncbi:MAG: imidazole glycerol phosphate synthase, glutamine amidotransferase subunit [Candidatus Yanofskybacteria bacterium RIFCSPHIGHO2_12_FULL_41_9]|nr:MAG: imidazole glycerol phosphate synthase, glutamine amidotransferase subunit [Candidatus Yanofskybacteria bacterium RIFCSPHIGHO2_12_FULL_41_9]
MTTSLKKVVIIDYQMGNVASVIKAFEKLGAKIKLSRNKNDIEKAEYLVLPGVGAFGDGMKNLKQFGIIDVLSRQVKKGVPFLGICLGMQLLAERGYEFGECKGLGWIKGKVIKLKSPTVPHIGWNDVKVTKNKKILSNLPDNNFYFIHSYFLKPNNKSIIAATCKHGHEFTAAIEQGNIWGTQFHPEKSQSSGLKVLDNFLNYHA